MRCAEWEERVALAAGGDLSGGAAAEVEAHLARCAACRAFAAELRDGLDLLRESHADTIPAGAYTAVRARVMAKIARCRAWRFAWACAAAAMLLAVAGFQGGMRVEPLPHVALAPPRPAPLEPAGVGHLEAEQARPAPRRRRAGRAVVAQASNETVLVKLETDNPDVVIYWIAEAKGAN